MSLIPYPKPPLCHEDKVKLMASRGLVITDPVRTLEYLQRINYYRLTGYCHPFKQADGNYVPGTTFEDVLRLYEFDRRLRLLVLDAIERVEVQLRQAVAYTLAHAYGAFAHEDPANLEFSHNGHAIWIEHLRTETKRSSEVFIDHFRNKYLEYPKLPIWMVVEVMSLGGLSRLFEAMKRDDARSAAKFVRIHHKILESWLHVLTYIRNLCAHHARLWNRELAVKPKWPWKDPLWDVTWVPTNGRIYFVLLLLRKLTLDHHAADDWANAAIALLREMDEVPRWQVAMGLPTQWAEHPLWKL